LESIKDIFLFDPAKPLLFTQMYFWIFFVVVLAVYSLIYPHKTARNSFLFFVSLFFYWKTSGLFFILLIFSTVTDYYFGYKIFREKNNSLRKFFVGCSIAVNLGVLAYFKYSYL
jgi:D-alanyl-lipoteichoic acid acyltransferase DltB (MBOAT superfamily)